jgi:hypothetical protein
VTADFEFESAAGHRPVPVCVVARELLSGRVYRIFEGGFPPAPPWATGPDVIFVAYAASADLGCYRVIGWPMPENILDLYVEFRNYTNGLKLEAGSGLLGALAFFGLDGLGAAYKEEIRKAIGDGVWRERYTRTEILDYCETDGEALDRLLVKMWPHIDLPRALLRGRYIAAVSFMEHIGIPIDEETLELLREHWDVIKEDLIRSVDKDFGVYVDGSFKQKLFAAYLLRNNIPWPLLDGGGLDLRHKTFEQQAQTYPAIVPLMELRATLSRLRLNKLAAGLDGCNRCPLKAFGARSSRNTPSNNKHVFGPAKWIRGLVKPPPGHAFIYPDWKAMEFGIAAAKSGDPRMREAYKSDDCYLTFAKQAGAAPPEATTETHSDVRDQYKTCVLGVQYGIQTNSLGDRLGGRQFLARELLRAHKMTYFVFWRWIDFVVSEAMFTNVIKTEFDWTLHIIQGQNTRSLMNFPMQATGAEIMRVAAILMTERGIPVGGVVHDAFAICCPLDQLEAIKAAAESAMREASRIVLGGFELDVEIKKESIVQWPNRYMDKRGKDMWDTVMALLDKQMKKRHIA